MLHARALRRMLVMEMEMEIYFFGMHGLLRGPGWTACAADIKILWWGFWAWMQRIGK